MLTSWNCLNNKVFWIKKFTPLIPLFFDIKRKNKIRLKLEIEKSVSAKEN